MNVTTTTIATNQQHLASMRALESVIAGKLSKNNAAPAGDGATNYGKVVNGTVLSKDSNGVLHPCGCIELSDAASAVNALPVSDARNFFVGDIVSLVAMAAQAKAIVAGDNPSNLTVTPAVPNVVVDIVVAGTSTAFSVVVSLAAGVKTITVNSATDGGGAATTTVGEVAAALLAIPGLIASAVAETAADLVVDVGPTALVAEFDLIADSVNVTAVDKTSSPNTVTVDGSAITAPTGSLLVKDGAYKPRGILDGTKSTVRYIDDTEVASARTVDVRYEGDLRTSQIVGAGAFLRRCLTGDAFPDVLNGGVAVQPEHAGFVFRNV